MTSRAFDMQCGAPFQINSKWHKRFTVKIIFEESILPVLEYYGTCGLKSLTQKCRHQPDQENSTKG